MTDETEREEEGTEALRAALRAKASELREAGAAATGLMDRGDLWLDDALYHLVEIFGSHHRRAEQVSDSDLTWALRCAGVVLDSYEVRFERAGSAVSFTLSVHATSRDMASAAARRQLREDGHVADPDAWYVADVD